jgi:hypothetical protein
MHVHWALLNDFNGVGQNPDLRRRLDHVEIGDRHD